METTDERDELRKRLGSRIALARVAAGYTQTELGVLIGVEKMTISRWERGVRSPTADYLFLISQELGCTADFLLGLSDVLEVRK